MGQSNMNELRREALEAKRAGNMPLARALMARLVELGANSPEGSSGSGGGGSTNNDPSRNALLTILRTQAQQCQQTAKQCHALGDMRRAALFVSRQRAFVSDIGSGANLEEAKTITVDVELPILVPQEALENDISDRDIAPDTLVVHISGLCASKGGDEISPMDMVSDRFRLAIHCDWEHRVGHQTDTLHSIESLWSEEHWQGLVPNTLRTTKFIEHRKIRIDLFRSILIEKTESATASSKGASFGWLSSIFGKSPKESPTATIGLPLETPREGETLVGSVVIPLAPLLGSCRWSDRCILSPPGRPRPANNSTVGASRNAPISYSLLVTLSARTALSRDHLIARYASMQHTVQWTVIPCGASGAAFGVAPIAPPVVQSDMDLLCCSYVVMEEELSLFTSHPPSTLVCGLDAEGLQAKLDAMASAVDEGHLSMDAYVGQVRGAIRPCKERAIQCKRGGDLPGAQAWLRRVRLMEGEIAEVDAQRLIDEVNSG